MMLVNGHRQDHLSAHDRGLHFGDGVFETVAIEDGRALCLDRHLARLTRGCARLAIRAPGAATLEEECARVCDGVGRAVLKLVITRGASGRGYAPDPRVSATRVVARYPWPQYPADSRSGGVAVRICATRLGRNPRLAGVKHLNRLEQVLARIEEDPAGCDEGIMLDGRGRVIAGIMCNVFARRGERLCTPDLSGCGVAGIMRELVLEAAQQVTGLEPQVATLAVDELSSAEECFLTNSLIGIWPIKIFDGKPLRVGPVAHELQKLLIGRGAMTRD
ncbi:MAG: aminodeoxychorismate lyase [Gammaproteobacteria bacterium]|nr:MAG: aminodeoxychorismate lyase [Gammaproteobacteria bacterium]